MDSNNQTALFVIILLMHIVVAAAAVTLVLYVRKRRAEALAQERAEAAELLKQAADPGDRDPWTELGEAMARFVVARDALLMVQVDQAAKAIQGVSTAMETAVREQGTRPLDPRVPAHGQHRRRG